jgi:hypothetical protein
MKWSCDWSRVALALIVVFMFLGTPFLWAQTLGTAPIFNTAVPGQTGAQPEGAFKNFVNWIGNVVAPIGAGGRRVRSGRGVHVGTNVRTVALASAMLLAISGVTRLLEFWVLQGVGGVS